MDYKIKKNVLADAFRLLNFNRKKRVKMIKELQKKTIERILTGKVNKIVGQEREQLKAVKLQERFQFEATRMRGYELIFPSSS